MDFLPSLPTPDNAYEIPIRRAIQQNVIIAHFEQQTVDILLLAATKTYNL